MGGPASPGPDSEITQIQTQTESEKPTEGVEGLSCEERKCEVGEGFREPADPRWRSSKTRGALTSCRRVEKEVRTSRNPEAHCPFATAMRSRPGTRASPGPVPPHSLLAGWRDPQASSLPRTLSGPTQGCALPRASLTPQGYPKRLGKLPRPILGHSSRAPAATLH